MVTDPIADMLTRLRNGMMARHDNVLVPYSKLKESLLSCLKKSGYIQGYEKTGEKASKMVVHLRYTHDKRPIVTGIARVSTPGRRVYKGYSEIKPVMSGLGVLLLSTPQGILTDREAREKKVGGEVLCKIW
ncbi:MAG: 30S ribosomal protein S8 [Deltaproteobacteria bacterium]|nr:30S ribosomal protein S8 [Deltaproteobacteria bacterium]